MEHEAFVQFVLARFPYGEPPEEEASHPVFMAVHREIEAMFIRRVRPRALVPHASASAPVGVGMGVEVAKKGLASS